MNWYRKVAFCVILSVAVIAIASPLYNIGTRDEVPYTHANRGPVNSATLDEADILFPLSRVGTTFEYYLGTGALGDTFAIVMEPVAACSVYTVQYQWFDAGTMTAFVANYSQAARDSFPTGRATVRRGQTAISPIGSIIRTFTLNNVTTTNAWATADVGSPFVVGTPSTGAANKFVVGFVKGGTAPHPLADNVTTRGFTYTWFGGPFTSGRWGAYSSASATTLTDVAARCMVSYPWGAPIIIDNLKQLSDSYSRTGPWYATVDLYDDGAGITTADQLRLKWKIGVNGTINTVTIPSTPVSGTNTFGVNITSTTAVPVDSTIYYWVDCIDDGAHASSTVENPLMFKIVAPTNGTANMLIVTDNLSNNNDGDRWDIYADAFTRLNIASTRYEIWDISSHNGIDGSVINHGWNNIMYLGWGNNGGIPATTYATTNAWATFINNGHNLMIADQDYFFGAGLSDRVNFSAGQFAYDKLGVGSCYSDPPDSLIGDVSFDGTAGDPISGAFATTSFLTHPEAIFQVSNDPTPSRHNWNDPITVSTGTAVFEGANDGLIYGVRKVTGTAKTVLFPILLEAAGSEAVDTAGNVTLTAGNQLPTLLNAVMGWWGFVSAPEPVSMTPGEFKLNAAYPNPFNPTVTIGFTLPKLAKATLKIYDMSGREVSTLVSTDLFAGSYKATWNATGYASGMYIAKLESGNRVATQKLLLVK